MRRGVQRAALAAVIVTVAACQGEGARPADAPPRAAADAAGGGFARGGETGDAPETGGGGDDGAGGGAGNADPTLPTQSGAPPAEPAGAGVADHVTRLGAIPAWRAVVDRNQYLARRGERAVVFGRVGGEVPPTPVAAAPTDAGPPPPPPPTGLTWLIDETEGQGALAIRVKMGASPPKPGERVAVAGAWALDEARRWYWQAEAVTPLPADEAPAPGPADAAPVAPGLVIAKVSPPGRRKDPATVRDGEVMELTVVKVPAREGDGWAVSDRKWGEVLAYLVLPGERPSYGGHDLRAPDERWTLKRNWTYWVRVAKVKRREGEPAVITAAGPPFLFP